MRLLLAAVLAAATTGCAGGLRSHAPPTVAYVLRAGQASQPSAAHSPGAHSAGAHSGDAHPGGSHSGRAGTGGTSLRVLRPIPGPGLDSDHIALARADRRLTWYASSRWAAALPDVVESLAVETLRGSGQWRAVEDSRGAVVADDFLQIGIRRFEAEESGSGPPVVHVALDCTLGRSEDRALIASFTVERDEQAPENRLGPVVAAFERAIDAALTEAAERAAAAAAGAEGPAPSAPAPVPAPAPSAPGPDHQKFDSPVASISR